MSRQVRRIAAAFCPDHGASSSTSTRARRALPRDAPPVGAATNLFTCQRALRRCSAQAPALSLSKRACPEPVEGTLSFTKLRAELQQNSPSFFTNPPPAGTSAGRIARVTGKLTCGLPPRRGELA